MFRLPPLNRSLIFDYALVCLVLLLITWIRVRLIDTPFDRDEGEYAYAGRQILKGNIPYKDMYNMKYPGVYYMYALFFKLFGITTEAIRIGGLLLNVGTAWFIFGFTRNILNARTGRYAAITFLILSLTVASESLMTNAENFVLFFGWGGLFFISNSKFKSPILFICAGACFLSLCCLMKQTGAIYILLGCMIFISIHKQTFSFKKIVGFILFGLIPFLILIVHLAVNNSYATFHYFTFQYATEYAHMVNQKLGAYLFKKSYSDIFNSTQVFVLIAVVGLFISFYYFKTFKWLYLWIGLLATVTMIVPGLYFRNHYFIYLNPLLAIVFAYTIVYVAPLLLPTYKWGYPMIIFFIASFHLCWNGHNYEHLFKQNGEMYSRSYFNYGIYADAEKIGNYINSITKPTDHIGSLTNEPEVFFHADRKMASSFFYIYPLMEHHVYVDSMRNAYIQQIETAKPEVFVVFDYLNSGPNKTSGALLDKWWTGYEVNYNLDCAFCTTGPIAPFNYVFARSTKVFKGVYCIKIYTRKHY